MPSLTQRQEQVLALLNEGVQARDIAKRLDITRNAVYQQIQALKKKGALAEDYTPSGERRIPASSIGQGADLDKNLGSAEDLLKFAVGHRDDTTPSAALDVIHELVLQQRQLIEVIAQLSARK